MELRATPCHMEDIMKVCIIGASGKLGQYMITHALERGYEKVRRLSGKDKAAADRDWMEYANDAARLARGSVFASNACNL